MIISIDAKQKPVDKIQYPAKIKKNLKDMLANKL